MENTTVIKLNHNEMAEMIVEGLIQRGKITSGNINISMAYNANVEGGTGREVITLKGCELTITNREGVN